MKNTIIKGIAGFFTVLLPSLFGTFLPLGYRWVFSVWDELDVNEVIYQLNAPLEGTGNGMIRQFVLTSIVPSLIITAVVCVLVGWMEKRTRQPISTPESGEEGVSAPHRENSKTSAMYKAVRIAIPVLGILSAAVILRSFWVRLKVRDYLNEMANKTTFIEDNYVDPAETEITFPDKKRNLIFVYLESMEKTYADEKSGGAFKENVIPELTEIAMENEDFSGSDNTLNGGRVMSGNGITMSAIFGISGGLPLKVNVKGLSPKFINDNKIFDKNDMSTQDHFYDNTMMLGDILKEQGYRQIFMLGSDATFGGRRLFFGKHGDFEIKDYLYAQEQGWIDQDYKVFWGYEDEKLFQFARNTLTEIAEGDEPFNLTLLTVDTHFEDGYICRLCDDHFGDNQYANAMACSDRQVAEFVRWCMQQDFYQNTTIILTGDHTTMDRDFCQDVPKDYERATYTAVINAAASPADPERRRMFSTQDLFPTTIASLGATIEGDRLGLGTNLFSSRDTLLEEMGYDALTKEESARSEFMDRMSDIDLYDKAYEKKGEKPTGWLSITDVAEDGTVSFRLDQIRRLYVKLDKVEVVIFPKGVESTEETVPGVAEEDIAARVELFKTEDGVYEGTADLGDLDLKKYSANVVAKTVTGEEYVLRKIRKLSAVIKK